MNTSMKNIEWAVMHPSYPDELHRGPYETFEEAQAWINEAVEDGFKEDMFYVGYRVISGWEKTGGHFEGH